MIKKNMQELYKFKKKDSKKYTKYFVLIN